MLKLRAQWIVLVKRLPASLPAIFAMGLVLRVLALVFYRMIDSDSAHYGSIARFFAEGHWQRALDPYWPPLYPFIISLFVRLGVSLEASGIAVSLLASSGIVVLCYFLGKRFGGDRVGRVAAILAAIHPRLIAISQSYMTEPLYSFFSTGALIAFVLIVSGTNRGLGKRASLFFATGIILAAAFLTRPEALFYFILICGAGIWLLIVRPALRSGVPKTSPAAAAGCLFLLLAGFLLPSLPYLTRVTSLQKRLTLGEKAEANFYLAYKEDYQKAGIRVELSDYESITSPETPRQPGNYHILSFLQRRPGKIAPRMLKNFIGALGDKIPSLMYWPLILLSLFGLVSVRKVKGRPSNIDFILWIFVPVLLYSPLFLYRRFFTPLLPPMIVWCAVGIDELRSRLSHRAFVASMIAGAMILLALTPFSLSRQSWPVLYKEAGLWLKTNAKGPVIIAGRKPEISFYAGAEFHPLNARKLDDLQQFLKTRKVTHLVVEDYILPASHPGLASLLDPGSTPPWLVPVYTGHKEGRTLILYEFLDPPSKQE